MTSFYICIYNQINNFSIITYARVLRRTAYPITGAQYALGPFEMIKNYLIRLIQFKLIAVTVPLSILGCMHGYRNV